MGLNDILHIIYSCLPDSPVCVESHLSADFSHDGGEDLISALPDDLLRSVVSRLPVKDAARTAVLSSRWRGLWRATPLVLDDGHILLQDGQHPIDHEGLAATISCILTSHPGPFHSVDIAHNFLSYKEDQLAEWLRLFAAKGVENLTLVNRPWPLDMALPVSIPRCGASLRRLYLGVWKFPDTTGQPRGPDVFPHLRELGICHSIMDDHDLEYVIACSPKLKIFGLIVSYASPERVRINSHSLRCALFWLSMPDEVAILDAPHLQRLILYFTPLTTGTSTMKVKIGYAPELTVLGYLDTSSHVLEIGNTIIKAGATNVSPNAMVPSVKVLALKVRFRVAKEVKTLLSFLRCFPQVETLHVMSSGEFDDEDDMGETSDKNSSMFWEEASPIECVQWHVRMVLLDQYRGADNETGFLKLVLVRAQMLQKVEIKLSPASVLDASGKLKPLAETNWANKAAEVVLGVGRGHDAMSYRKSSDLSLSDPFSD